MPMRSVPFQMVALLGLQDSGFPRQENRLSFDKLAYDSQRKGDRSRRDEDPLFIPRKFVVRHVSVCISAISVKVCKIIVLVCPRC